MPLAGLGGGTLWGRRPFLTMCTVSASPRTQIIHACSEGAWLNLAPDQACAGWGKISHCNMAGPTGDGKHVCHVSLGALLAMASFAGRDGFDQIGLPLNSLGNLIVPNCETYEHLYPVHFLQHELRSRRLLARTRSISRRNGSRVSRGDRARSGVCLPVAKGSAYPQGFRCARRGNWRGLAPVRSSFPMAVFGSHHNTWRGPLGTGHPDDPFSVGRRLGQPRLKGIRPWFFQDVRDGLPGAAAELRTTLRRGADSFDARRRLQ